MKKWIKRIAIIAAALVIVGVLIVWLSLNSIVRSGVEIVGTTVTGQTTTLESADLSIFGGSVSLSGLKVANPREFSSSEFVDLKNVKVAVKTSTLLSNTIEVDDVSIQDLHLTIEQSGLASNVNTILGQIKKQQKSDDAGASAGSGKQLKVKKITLKNTSVTMNMGLPGQKAQGVTLSVPEIVIQDAANPDGRVMKAADLVGQILVGVLAQIKNDINLPPEFKNAIGGSLEIAGENMQKLVNDLGKIGQGSATQVGKPINDAFKGVGDLFKKDKK